MKKATIVTFTPSPSIFGVDNLLDMEGFIVTRMIEIAATHKKKVKVYYNNKLINIQTFMRPPYLNALVSWLSPIRRL